MITVYIQDESNKNITKVGLEIVPMINDIILIHSRKYIVIKRIYDLTINCIILTLKDITEEIKKE